VTAAVSTFTVRALDALGRVLGTTGPVVSP
jgi:hypothetical protein